MTRNLFGKSRPKENPYATYKLGSWEWRVLKTYQRKDKDTMVTKINLQVFSDKNVAVSCERTTHRYGDSKYHYNKGYINTLIKNGRDSDGTFAKPKER